MPHPGGLTDADCLTELNTHRLAGPQLAALEGREYVPPQRRPKTPQVAPTTMRDLDAREQAVVRMTIEGLTQAKMAKAMGCNIQTIKAIKARVGVKEAIGDRLLALDQRTLKYLAEGEAAAAQYLAKVASGELKPQRDRVTASVELLNRMGKRGPPVHRTQQTTTNVDAAALLRAVNEPEVRDWLLQQAKDHPALLGEGQRVVNGKLLTETVLPDGEVATVEEDYDPPPEPETVKF